MKRAVPMLAGMAAGLVMATTAYAGPLDDADAAFKGADYATALKLIRPLAEQGNDEAQNDLGFMYRNGLGLEADPDAAFHWFQLSAEQGNVFAQGNLGAMYLYGLGVPADHVMAYLWFALAADQGDEEAHFQRDRMAALLSNDQLAQAEQMEQTWQPHAYQ
jgi:TPR repeat protein